MRRDNITIIYNRRKRKEEQKIAVVRNIFSANSRKIKKNSFWKTRRNRCIALLKSGTLWCPCSGMWHIPYDIMGE